MSLQTLAATLAGLEGNGTSDINGRANNPLNIEAGNLGLGTITTSNGGQVTVYPSVSAGQAAGLSHLQAALASAGQPGPYQNVQTFADFLNVWAGNPGTGYITQAAASIGVTASTPIGQVQALLGLGGVTASSGVSGGVSAPPTVPAAQDSDLLGTLGADIDGAVSGEGLPLGFILVAVAAFLVVWLLGD